MKLLQLAWILLLGSQLAFAESNSGGDSDFLKTAPKSDLFPSLTSNEVSAPLAGLLTLKAAEIDMLLDGGSDAIVLSSMDQFTGAQSGSMKFQRVDMFAPGARIRSIVDGQVEVLQTDTHIFYRGMNDSTGIAFSVNQLTGEVSGFSDRDGLVSTVTGNVEANIEFSPMGDSTEYEFACSAAPQMLPLSEYQDLHQQLQSQTANISKKAVQYQTVIAVDTDNEWMSGRTNNNANKFITDLFQAMNLFFESDVNLRLLVGDVTLRGGGGDPYGSDGTVNDHLYEFGEYWFNNMGGVDRDFAMMLSGRGDIASNQFSGTAWIDAYCNNGQQANANGDMVIAGSYSIARIGSDYPADQAANPMAHEITHNLGSTHTHCYNPPIDSCYNAEQGCYDGDVSCPQGGKGTVMSYCNFGAPGGADCGNNNDEFHPTVQTLVEGRLAANSPACIAPFSGGGGNGVAFTSGFSDAWRNGAKKGGQGVFMIVYPGLKLIFMAWFTYDTELPPNNASQIVGFPGQAWYTMFGSFDGDTAELDIEFAHKGIFNSATNPVRGTDGTVTVTAVSCEEITFKFNIDSADEQDTLTFERLTDDLVGECESQQ